MKSACKIHFGKTKIEQQAAILSETRCMRSWMIYKLLPKVTFYLTSKELKKNRH